MAGSRPRRFEGCSFINVLLEHEPGSPVRRAAVGHLATIRDFLRALAVGAGVCDPDDFARRWHILMKGSIVAAAEGDRAAARRAREIGVLLLEHSGATTSVPRRAGRGLAPRLAAGELS